MKIIGLPDGLLKTAGAGSIDYNGLTIEYSGTDFFGQNHDRQPGVPNGQRHFFGLFRGRLARINWEERAAIGLCLDRATLTQRNAIELNLT